MGTITLVRHGQANSAAQDEESYDRLSDLGRQQAAWLGDHMRAQGESFDLVLCGSLNRHIATAEAMGRLGPATVIDPRLNEMDYFNLSQALHETHDIPPPGPESFALHIEQVMEAWHKAEIMGQESFAAFEERVTGVLAEAAEPGKRVLCVTSGGVIGMVVRHLLRLDPTRLAPVLLPIFNSSVHRVQVLDHATILGGFNAIPHLEAQDRAHARTHF